MGVEFGKSNEKQQVKIEQKEASLEEKLDFLSDATGSKRDYENFIKFLNLFKNKNKKEEFIKLFPSFPLSKWECIPPSPNKIKDNYHK